MPACTLSSEKYQVYSPLCHSLISPLTSNGMASSARSVDLRKMPSGVVGLTSSIGWSVAESGRGEAGDKRQPGNGTG